MCRRTKMHHTASLSVQKIRAYVPARFGYWVLRHLKPSVPAHAEQWQLPFKSGRSICIEIGSRLGDGPSKISPLAFFRFRTQINRVLQPDCSFKAQSLQNTKQSSRKSEERTWWEIDLRRPFMFTKRGRVATREDFNMQECSVRHSLLRYL